LKLLVSKGVALALIIHTEGARLTAGAIAGELRGVVSYYKLLLGDIMGLLYRIVFNYLVITIG